MESRWRLNAWETGLWDLPYNLYARLLGFSNRYVTTFNPKSSPLAHILVITYNPPGSLTPNEQFDNGGDAVKPLGAGSAFPYGFAVEPDH